MNIKRLLSQYTDLKAEIKDLEKRIERLSEARFESDVVTGSDDEFPYLKKHIKIEGYNIQNLDRLKELRELLLKRKNKCEEMKLEIEKFISDIPDSRTRRVFQYRYVDGLSWLQIAFKIGKYDESYPRKVIHDKYLEEIREESV